LGKENSLKKLFAALAIAALPVVTIVAFTFAPMALAHRGVHHYSTLLRPLNGSGVTGVATMDLEGSALTVTVVASGLEANRTHMQHIHAIDHGNSTCPPPSADTNGDGIVSFAEGLPFYGPVRLPLTISGTTYPMIGASGSLSYSRTFTVDPKAFLALQTKVVVLHGLSINGTYDPTTPVACGQIRVQPNA
jgi:hypothetical protein